MTDKRPPPTNNRFDAYDPGDRLPPSGSLRMLGVRPAKAAPAPPARVPTPPPLPRAEPDPERPSDPFKPELPTRPNSPAHRAQRLIGAWAKLSPARQALIEELVAELEKP